MGDKGGKKDKEKNKQQQVTKHKQEGQKSTTTHPPRSQCRIRVKRIRFAANGVSSLADDPPGGDGKHHAVTRRDSDVRKQIEVLVVFVLPALAFADRLSRTR